MQKFDLVGIDGNAYSVMGYVSSCMKKAGFTKEDISKYMEEAKSEDYNHLLCVSMDMVDKCNEKLGLNSPDNWEDEDEYDEEEEDEYDEYDWD